MLFITIVLAFYNLKACYGHVLGVKSISKSFISKTWFGLKSRNIVALQDVTCDFSRITALCGSSGSGKSTLAKLVW